MITIALRDSEEGALAGVFQAGPGDGGAAGAVVAAPHPLYGGSMDAPVVAEVAWACVRAGLDAVRFNWRGVGASTGVASGDPVDADRDLGAALAYAAESVPGKVLVAGYSFGAAAALRAARLHPRIDRVVVVAPPASMLGAAGFEGLPRALVVLGRRDTLARPEPVVAAAEGHAHVTVRLVDEADHFFAAGLAYVGRFVSEWLAP
jgi:alpha/beta superfamily hydrolase